MNQAGNPGSAARRRRLLSLLCVVMCGSATLVTLASEPDDRSALAPLTVDRNAYADRLQGFWLGLSIANWTGLVTEMDKIGGEGPAGVFYTRHDWGGADAPNIWSEAPSPLSAVIDWVLVGPDAAWGADDDSDIEYMYQHLLSRHGATVLTPGQIRDGWLRHIWSDEDTPFRDDQGRPENYLWVSNQRAHDLMRVEGLEPPATGDPEFNPHFDMIDAQLTTEIFGLFAPGRPDVALRMAHLPIRTVAREEAAQIAEFYVIMYALAAAVDPARSREQQVRWMAAQARRHLPDGDYPALMYGFVAGRFAAGVPWEQARDEVYRRYQVEQAEGYDLTSRNLDCNGCFAAGINFAASLVSLLYGRGDFEETVKIAVLAGWDSDNPAATWGGLLGFMDGREALSRRFDRALSHRFHIHRTRRAFPPDAGIDTFGRMAEEGIEIVDRVVEREMGGTVDLDEGLWRVPQALRSPR